MTIRTINAFPGETEHLGESPELLMSLGIIVDLNLCGTFADRRGVAFGTCSKEGAR